MAKDSWGPGGGPVGSRGGSGNPDGWFVERDPGPSMSDKCEHSPGEAGYHLGSRNSSCNYDNDTVGEGGGGGGIPCLMFFLIPLAVLGVLLSLFGCGTKGSTNPEYVPPSGQAKVGVYITPEPGSLPTYFPASTLKNGVWYVYVKDPTNPGTCQWSVSRLDGGSKISGTATNKTEHDQFTVSAGDDNVMLTSGCDHARLGG